jgi:hypothetical protein
MGINPMNKITIIIIILFAVTLFQQVGAMAEDGKFRVKKFNSQNYQLWKMQMEDYLYQKDLFYHWAE